MKPGEKIFKDVLAKLGLKPEECVYIDDIKKYVEAAKKLGINDICYIDEENLILELKKLKVIID